MKSQDIRLLDVFVLGPFMIWAGYEIGKKKDLAGMVLAASGVATIAYNWKNYKAIENEKTPTT
jgi:hypothetical protein